MFDGWGVALNGVIVTGSCDDPQAAWDDTGCSPAVVLDFLSAAPDIGFPAIRNEDVQFPQRDGIKAFSDWYDPRTVVLTGMLGPVDACTCETPENCECLTVRGQLSSLVQAWKRSCCDVEMVVYPPCEPGTTEEEKALTGPFGLVGRPRGISYQWLSRSEQIVEVQLVFQANDQRAYVLDDCGTPGFANCVDITPGTESLVACWDDDTGELCFGAGGICFTTVVPGTEHDAGDILVGGTEKVYPEFTLYPNMANPRIVNLTTGEYISYTGLVTDVAVTINTERGTAFDSNGVSQTHRLGGNIFMGLDPSNYEFRVFQTGDYPEPEDPEDPEDPDTLGFLQVCWRSTVVVI